MWRSVLGLAVIAGLLVFCPRVFAAGGVHRKGPIGKVHSDWPDALVGLINSDGRVHGHWVNASDEFFYQGDNGAVERFLAVYGKLADTPLKVIIHAGSARRSALWGEKPETAYDWKLLIQRRGWGAPLDPERPKNEPGYVVTVDVWIDGGVNLEKLKVPRAVKVESAGEIEKYIADHEARRAKAERGKR